MPIVIFSYDKGVESAGTGNVTGPIEISTTLDFIPGPRNWTLVNFTWTTATNNSTPIANLFTELASSCKLFPDFLLGQSHAKMGHTDVTATGGYPAVTSNSTVPFIRKNSFPFNLAAGVGVNYAMTFDQQSFNPISFGVVDITHPVLTIKFQGDGINTGTTTTGLDKSQNIIKFDAIFHYE